MIKKEILIPSIVGLVSTVSALMIGIAIGKKRYSPKITSGEIYIDYITNSNRDIFQYNSNATGSSDWYSKTLNLHASSRIL